MADRRPFQEDRGDGAFGESFGEYRGGMAFREVFTPNREGPLPPRPKPSGKGGPSVNQGSAPAHSAEALAYLARTTGGNEGGNGANIATLIDGLVTDGVWAKLDALYVLAQQNQSDALLNLIGTSYGLAGSLRDQPSQRALTFTQYVGFSGFLVGLDTNFNGATAPSPKYTQNSASIGVWAYATSSETVPVFGQIAAGSTSNLYPSYGGTAFYVRINDILAGSVPTPGTKGLFTGDRSVSTSVVPYWNGVSQGAVSSPSGSVFSSNFRIGSAGGQDPTVQTLSAAFIGASLGSAGQLALYNRLRTYMSSIGVP